MPPSESLLNRLSSELLQRSKENTSLSRMVLLVLFDSTLGLLTDAKKDALTQDQNPADQDLVALQPFLNRLKFKTDAWNDLDPIELRIRVGMLISETLEGQQLIEKCKQTGQPIHGKKDIETALMYLSHGRYVQPNLYSRMDSRIKLDEIAHFSKVLSRDLDAHVVLELEKLTQEGSLFFITLLPKDGSEQASEFWISVISEIYKLKFTHLKIGDFDVLVSDDLDDELHDYGDLLDL